MRLWRFCLILWPKPRDHDHALIDIDVSPAEIVWSKRELAVDERKSALIGQANAEFQAVVDAQLAIEMAEDDASGDLDAVPQLRLLRMLVLLQLTQRLPTKKLTRSKE